MCKNSLFTPHYKIATLTYLSVRIPRDKYLGQRRQRLCVRPNCAYEPHVASRCILETAHVWGE